MSTRRRPSRSSSSSAAASITDEQINDLLLKLQAALRPHHRRLLRSTDGDVTAAGRVLQEACSRIRSLQREVDGLSERLSQLLTDDGDVTGARAASLVRSLLSNN